MAEEVKGLLRLVEHGVGCSQVVLNAGVVWLNAQGFLQCLNGFGIFFLEQIVEAKVVEYG